MWTKGSCARRRRRPRLRIPNCWLKAGLSLLATSSMDGLPDVETYTDERLAEFAQGEAELDEVLRRKGLRSLFGCRLRVRRCLTLADAVARKRSRVLGG